MRWAVVDSPVGGVGVAVQGDAVCAVCFGALPDLVGGERRPAEPPVLAQARRQLEEYLTGERCEFGLPVVLRRGSDFERAVWAAIAAIPYGETRSYGEIARAVGREGGAQAVGIACNRNPVPVIVACHRVVGANGALVGFGGGLTRKRWLLSLEARVSPLLPPVQASHS